MQYSPQIFQKITEVYSNSCKKKESGFRNLSKWSQNDRNGRNLNIKIWVGPFLGRKIKMSMSIRWYSRFIASHCVPMTVGQTNMLKVTYEFPFKTLISTIKEIQNIWIMCCTLLILLRAVWKTLTRKFGRLTVSFIANSFLALSKSRKKGGHYMFW